MFLRVELIARSWSFFSRKRAQRPMDRKIFALRAPKEFGLRPPGSGDPFSNAHPRHAGGGSRHPVCTGLASAKHSTASVKLARRTLLTAATREVGARCPHLLAARAERA